MPDIDPWAKLSTAFDAAAAKGRTLRFWLRDDDAVQPTQALHQLCDLIARFDVPLLLAVIPKNAGKELAKLLAGHPLVSPCQHGFSHRNHAPSGERAQELGLHRPQESVLGELAAGRAHLSQLFGERLDDCVVPPWNRMDERLLPHLADLGFNAVSRFGDPGLSRACGLDLVNSTVDIIDWKNGKHGRSDADLIGKLQRQIETEISQSTASEVKIGILTHHLDHDRQAWNFLERLFAATRVHNAISWATLDAVKKR